MKNARACLILSSMLFVGSGCETAPEPRAGSGGALSPDEVVAARKIAEARCARQTPACGALVPYEQCVAAKLKRSVSDTELSRCDSAVVDADLDLCVAQIRAGRCGAGIGGIDACRHDLLCPPNALEGNISDVY